MKQLLLLALMTISTLITHATISKTEKFTLDQFNTSTDYVPMVVEGRTWWYSCAYSWNQREAEFGITIGKEVEIDNVNWHELVINLSSEYFFDGNWTFDTEPKRVAYMREEDGKVFTLLEPGSTGYLPIDTYIMGDFLDQLGQVIQVYDFGEINEAFMFGNQELSWSFKISEKDQVESHGYTYKRYKALEEESQYPLVSEFLYLEGIGDVTHSNSELMYVPFGLGSATLPRYYCPKLRYVTDAENNIIYEGMGGERIWEIYAGVGDVSYDEIGQPVRWYNLQGIEIDEPQQSGTYIRKQGNSARKMYVK